MLPENRMATLFQQAQQHQNSACLYHSGVSSPNFPLLADHVCSKETFPSVNTKTLNLHLDEVWCVTFSHNGKYLATAGKDGSILIWDASVGSSLAQTFLVN